ncbi:MAG: molybdopterin oxidoreductase [Actinomycetota bacterium]|nr:molybdopterin oxidoreductase [Actinomycetota bacterium]
MDSIPRFIQGVFDFTGEGLARPLPLDDRLPYRVPVDKRSQLVYFRAGNSADALVNLVLMRDGKLMRNFPIGAKSAVHVSLAVVEDFMPETRLDVLLAAPLGVTGTVVLDIGLIEVF